jgi:hypothetical protein
MMAGGAVHGIHLRAGRRTIKFRLSDTETNDNKNRGERLDGTDSRMHL